MLALGFKKERVTSPDVFLAGRHIELEGLGDFGGRRNGIADNPAANQVHHARHRHISVDNLGFAGILRLVHEVLVSFLG